MPHYTAETIFCHAFYTRVSGLDTRSNPVLCYDMNKLIDSLILIITVHPSVNNNSPIQDYVHPDDQIQPFEMTPGFKPFTASQ